MAKQLSLPERIIIEKMIHQNYSFATIGRHLNRSASTVAREFHLTFVITGSHRQLTKHAYIFHPPKKQPRLF